MSRVALPLLESFGGLETDTERSSRTPGRASTCTNFQVGAQGRTLQKMQGASRWVNDQMGGAVNVLGFFQFKDRGGSRYDVAKVPTDYYVSRDGGPVWDQAHTVTSSTGLPKFVAANAKMFVVDGQDALIWDGTGTGTARFTNWFRLRGPTSGTVGPANVDAPTASAINDTGLTDLAAETEWEVAFIFRDNSNQDKMSSPSAILRVRTDGVNNRQIRIDTGYVGRDKDDAATPDANTHGYLALPSDVAALDDDAHIVAIMSKADTPGAWYLDDSASAVLDDREIVRSDTLNGAVVSGATSLTMTTNISTTNIRAGDQVLLSPGLDEEEVVRVTVASGTTLTIEATNNGHDDQAVVVPIMSLIVSQNAAPGTTQYDNFHGPPRATTGIVSHMDAIWVWGSPNFPTRIWFTDPDEPETFPANNFIDVDPDDPFDPIVNIIPFGKGFGAELLILRKNSVWRLLGNDIDTFAAQLVQRGPSCVGVDAAVILPDGTICWAGFEDAYRFDGSSIISLAKDKIRHDWRSSFGLAAVGGTLT